MSFCVLSVVLNPIKRAAFCGIQNKYKTTKQIQLIVLIDSGQTDNRQQQKKDRQRTEEAHTQHTDSARNMYTTDRQKTATEGQYNC